MNERLGNSHRVAEVDSRLLTRETGCKLFESFPAHRRAFVQSVSFSLCISRRNEKKTEPSSAPTV